jgi:stage II sporulation protein D
MHYRKFLIMLAFVGYACAALHAADIRIGLFYNVHVESLVFSSAQGEYMVIGDGKQVTVVRKGTMFYIAQSSSGITLQDTLQSYGTFSTLEFKGISGANTFRVKPVVPALAAKESEDDLLVDLLFDNLRIINRIGFDKYIAGTLEAEGGSNAPLEYYKAQAVISRTFAMQNFSRHAQEGFNLCDGTHCQAYNGKSLMNKQIYEAVTLTRDMVLVDQAGDLAVTAFHSSCGGKTGDAALEWNRALPYLKPVNDPFCDHSKQRDWSKTIPVETWNKYLGDQKYDGNPADLFSKNDAGRQKYLDVNNKKLLLTTIRKDFILKSSYFHLESDDGNVIFKGHGFGHGLGLCQEGAMEMARVGYSYVDILMFYFNNLTLKRIAASDQ